MDHRVMEDQLNAGLELEPITGLKYVPGDRVAFTNDNGVVFPNHVVAGYYRPKPVDGRYRNGMRYFLDGYSPWFVRERNLEQEGMTVLQWLKLASTENMMLGSAGVHQEMQKIIFCFGGFILHYYRITGLGFPQCFQKEGEMIYAAGFPPVGPTQLQRDIVSRIPDRPPTMVMSRCKFLEMLDNNKSKTNVHIEHDGCTSILSKRYLRWFLKCPEVGHTDIGIAFSDGPIQRTRGGDIDCGPVHLTCGRFGSVFMGQV